MSDGSLDCYRCNKKIYYSYEMVPVGVDPNGLPRYKARHKGNCKKKVVE